MEKGCQEKALMFVDWTLNTNPNFMEAIKLREKLTNHKMEEAMQSSLSGFVREVLRDDAATTPDTGGAAHYYVPPATMPAK